MASGKRISVHTIFPCKALVADAVAPTSDPGAASAAPVANLGMHGVPASKRIFDRIVLTTAAPAPGYPAPTAGGVAPAQGAAPGAGPVPGAAGDVAVAAQGPYPECPVRIYPQDNECVIAMKNGTRCLRFDYEPGSEETKVQRVAPSTRPVSLIGLGPRCSVLVDPYVRFVPVLHPRG